MWKNIVEWGRPQMTIWSMPIACWIPKAKKYTHSGCVILVAFPLQQWLHERASMLGYTHIARLAQSYWETKFLHHLCNDSSGASISQFTLYPLRQCCLPSMTSSSMTNIPVAINKRHLQECKQPTGCNNNNFINNFNQLNMFRAIISPILRSTRLCLQLVV